MKYTVRELRARYRYTQEDLGKLVGVSKTTINLYENDLKALRNARYEIIDKMAEVFNVNIEDIDMDRI